METNPAQTTPDPAPAPNPKTTPNKGTPMETYSPTHTPNPDPTDQGTWAIVEMEIDDTGLIWDVVEIVTGTRIEAAHRAADLSDERAVDFEIRGPFHTTTIVQTDTDV